MAHWKVIIKSLIGATIGRTRIKDIVFKDARLILMYHRVIRKDDIGYYDPAMYVEPEVFEMHIRELRKVFQIVSIDELIASHEHNLPKCAITFDDGWRDNYDFAFPILRKCGVPATIFLVTDLVGQKYNFWFHDIWRIFDLMESEGALKYFIDVVEEQFSYKWRGEVDDSTICEFINYLKRFRAQDIRNFVDDIYAELGLAKDANPELMDWDHIREMNGEKINFGSHTQTHCILTNVSTEVKRREIIDSITDLRKSIAAPSNVFCYPNGNWDEESICIIKEAGYRGAVTTHLGTVEDDSNYYSLNRIAIHNEVSSTPALLWYRLWQAMH